MSSIILTTSSIEGLVSGISATHAIANCNICTSSSTVIFLSLIFMRLFKIRAMLFLKRRFVPNCQRKSIVRSNYFLTTNQGRWWDIINHRCGSMVAVIIKLPFFTFYGCGWWSLDHNRSRQMPQSTTLEMNLSRQPHCHCRRQIQAKCSVIGEG